jgi:MFS superfamily sulfate permease-like transporter
MDRIRNIGNSLKHNFPAGLVVYFVALPLCLAIAQASTGRPELVFSGIIAGFIGGIVIGILSGSSLGVSGPAAGLVVIVNDGINKLGTDAAGSINFMAGFEAFLLAVLICGVIQLAAGYLKAGIIGYYFPSSVIKGMLAAIGITLILKELPHIVGYDHDFMGDMSFDQNDGHNTFSEIYYAMGAFSWGAIIISAISLGILILFDRNFMKKFQLFKFLPGALFVVVFGVLLNIFLSNNYPMLALGKEHLVQLPVPANAGEFFSFFTFPDFSQFGNPRVYQVAFTLAIVASLETLLSVEAIDKLDPLKRNTPVNRELKAQGIGNMVSGLIGGLPLTQVIVRSSANVNAGGTNKTATVTHGVILLLSAFLIPRYLNFIPLATLAAILLLVGYKLAKVSLFRKMYWLGPEQFVPFICTIIAVLLSDLLRGIGIGMVVATFFILRKNYRNAFRYKTDKNRETEVIRLELSEEVTFLNKANISYTLDHLPNGTTVIIDGSRSLNMDHDVLEIIHEFRDHTAKTKDIKVELINIQPLPEPETSDAH